MEKRKSIEQIIVLSFIPKKKKKTVCINSLIEPIIEREEPEKKYRCTYPNHRTDFELTYEDVRERGCFTKQKNGCCGYLEFLYSRRK